MLVRLFFPEGEHTEIPRWPYDIPRIGDGFIFEGVTFDVANVLWEVNGMQTSVIIYLENL